MTFQLDTSGAVLMPHTTPEDPSGKWASDPVQWSDLSPFAQGYIEALFAEGVETSRESWAARGLPKALGFSDLAPEALVRIIADCEGRLRQWRDMGAAMPTAEGGRSFWKMRQAGKRADMGFPPLTVQLGDDGKVRFA